jgi:hypothetical protein
MSRPVAAVPPQGINRRVSVLSVLSVSLTCDTGSCDENFEHMTDGDGGVARTTPHAHRLWTFHQLLADMDSDTAGCLSDNRAEPPPAHTESPQAQVQRHTPPAHGQKRATTSVLRRYNILCCYTMRQTLIAKRCDHGAYVRMHVSKPELIHE